MSLVRTILEKWMAKPLRSLISTHRSTRQVSAPRHHSEVQRIQGVVKWFHEAKGFGFITPDDGGKDCFVHHSAIQTEGFRTLVEGQEVQFDLVKGQKGPAADNVTLVGQEPDSSNGAYIALALIGGRVRVVRLWPDGNYAFIDEAQSIHTIFYVNRESIAFKEAVEELEFLVNDARTQERDLQDFFERHPDLILSDEYRRLHPRITLDAEEGELIPDFVLEPVEQGGLCDLLELKLPSARAFVLKTNRYRFSAAVLEAAAQLRTYSEYFDDPRNREKVRERYGLTAYRPRMFVILGRRGEVDPLAIRAMEGDLPGLRLNTYDQIIERAKARANR